MATIRKRRPWEKKKKHTDTVHIEGQRRLTFSKGRNGYGARIDGKHIVLKSRYR